MEETIATMTDGIGAEVSASAGAEPDVVNLSDLFIDEAGGAAEPTQTETVTPEAHDGGAEPTDPIRSQKDFNAALRVRLQEKEASVSRRYESTPEYRLGQQLLRERMSREGISAQEAAARIERDMIAQQAAEYQKNPQRFYEDYLRTQNQPQARQTAPQDPAASIAQELIAAKEAGLLPDSFSPQHLTPEFIADVQEYGIKAAARIFAASAASADAYAGEVAARQRVPQPIRTSGSSMRQAKPNFATMTDAQFDAYNKRIEAELAKGKKVRF